MQTIPSQSLIKQRLFASSTPSINGLIIGEEGNTGTFRNKQPGRCKLFDGTDDRISGGTSAGDFTNNFTISFWIKTSTNGRVLCSRRGSANLADTQYYLEIQASTGYLRLVTSAGQNIIPGTTNVADGNWHHITIVFNSSNSRMYIDGDTEGSVFNPSITSRPSVNLLIGSWFNGTSNNFSGHMFDFRIYASALTATEVSHLYLLGSDALPNKPTHLHYKLDEQHSTIAYDSSGNNLNGLCISVNATVGNFFYEGADVPFSWENDKGFSTVPRFALNGKLTGSAHSDFDIEDVSTKPFSFTANITVPTTIASLRALFNIGTVDFQSFSLNIDGLKRPVLVGDSDGISSWNILTTGTGIMPSGTQRITLTRNTVGNYRVYFGDTLALNYTNVNDLVLNNFIPSIGGHYLNTTNGFEGFISDAKFYNIALTLSDIQLLISGYEPANLNIVADWPLSTFGMYEDVSGNNHHLTPTNLIQNNIPRNESNKIKNIFGSNLNYAGKCPNNAQAVSANCLTFDGVDDVIAVPSLVGDETVVSSEGTSTPTISAGEIDFTAGTCWNLLLSNGSLYPMSEGGGNKIYDVINSAHGTLTNANLTTAWATKQNVYHWNLTQGFNNSKLIQQTIAGGYVSATSWISQVSFSGNFEIEFELTNEDANSVFGVTELSSPTPSLNYLNFVLGAQRTSATNFRTWVGSTTDNHTVSNFNKGSKIKFARVGSDLSVYFNGVLQRTTTNSATLRIFTTHTTVGAGVLLLNAGADSNGTIGASLTQTQVRTPEIASTLPITNPAGAWHNYSESEINEKQGIPHPGSSVLVEDFHPSDSIVNPKFLRLSTKTGINTRVDRCVRYSEELSGNRLVSTQKYTQTKVL